MGKHDNQVVAIPQTDQSIKKKKEMHEVHNLLSKAGVGLRIDRDQVKNRASQTEWAIREILLLNTDTPNLCASFTRPDHRLPRSRQQLVLRR